MVQRKNSPADLVGLFFYYAYLINMCAGYIEKCAGGYKGNFGSRKFGHQHRMTNHQLPLNDDDNGKVMFVASDVAKILGYNRPNDDVNAHCRYTVKCRIPHSQGKGTLEVNIIPERGFVPLITHSKLPLPFWWE